MTTQPTNNGTAAQPQPRDKQLEQAIIRHCQNYGLMVENARNPELRDTYADFAQKSHDLLLNLIAQSSHTAVVEALAGLKEHSTLMKYTRVAGIDGTYQAVRTSRIDEVIAQLFTEGTK